MNLYTYYIYIYIICTYPLSSTYYLSACQFYSLSLSNDICNIYIYIQTKNCPETKQASAPFPPVHHLHQQGQSVQLREFCLGGRNTLQIHGLASYTAVLIFQGVYCEHWKVKSERTNELAGIKRSYLSCMAYASSYHLSNFHKNTNYIQIMITDQYCLFSFDAFLFTPSLSQALDLTFGTCHER